MADSNARKFPLEAFALAFILGLGALLLFWNLSQMYLWQDEAATAVLAGRMLHFGTPRAYDGVNLITTDQITTNDMKTMDQHTTNTQVAINYYISQGLMKPDTTWKWHPWGQFMVAAASLKLFGHTTLAARLPFATAGLLTVLALYWLVRKYCDSPLMAVLAALLLVCDAYWILHARQCRYYSLSSLFLVLTVLGYARWQWGGGHWGAAAFVVAAWCWFQVDYGTVWPVYGVLFLDAFTAGRKNFRQTFTVGALLAAALLPFIYYYEMWGRKGLIQGTWSWRFIRDLCNINQYVVPLLVMIVVAVLLWRRWDSLPPAERRLVRLALAIMIALLLWVSAMTPTVFLRYVIMAAPIGCLLSAWMLVRGFGKRAPLFAWTGAAILVITPWPCLLLPRLSWGPLNSMVRPENLRLVSEVFGHPADPNRLVIEWLKQHASPTDEILINYEDVPLMFYLPNPIRGGIANFRVEDDSKAPPRFVVLRHGEAFIDWAPYMRELQRYQWETIPVNIPQLEWGNNPDPEAAGGNPAVAPSLQIGRRIGPP